jgi:uncharacterized membrane protein YidH (DUF202 family)
MTPFQIALLLFTIMLMVGTGRSLYTGRNRGEEFRYRRRTLWGYEAVGMMIVSVLILENVSWRLYADAVGILFALLGMGLIVAGRQPNA